MNCFITVTRTFKAWLNRSEARCKNGEIEKHNVNDAEKMRYMLDRR